MIDDDNRLPAGDDAPAAPVNDQSEAQLPVDSAQPLDSLQPELDGSVVETVSAVLPVAHPPAELPEMPRRIVRGRSRRSQRTPWYLRSPVLYPGLFLIVMFGIFAWRWFSTPIENLATGESQTRWQQMGNLVSNVVRPKESLSKSFNGKQQITVLLLGLDHVPKTKKDPSIIHRNDSTLVASTDFKSRQIRIASVPRDGWVQHWQDGKNHGYEKFGFTYALGQTQNLNKKEDLLQGGVNRATETVEKLLDVDVDHYVVIEFEGFIRLIDAMGGLDVDVDKKMDWDDNAGDLHIHLKKGLQHLDGREVMGFARFRHDAMGDKARMLRQQKVIKLMLAKLRTPEMLPHLPELAGILHDCVQTSLSADQLLALAQHMDEYNLDEMESMSLMSYWAGEPGHERTLPGLSADQQKAHSFEEYIDPGDTRKVHEFLTDLNAAPKTVARLQQEVGSAPFTARLDASDSRDRDGTVTSYEVDWNGDGNFEEQGASPVLSHEYEKPGEYTINIRVLDDKGKPGAPQSFQLLVTAAPEQAARQLQEPGNA